MATNQYSGRMSRTELVEDFIIEQIANGTWSAGARIATIGELSSQLDVSSTTVRGALQSLSAMGLLEIRHGVGTFVKIVPRWLQARPEMWRALMREETLFEIHEARELLEVQMAGLAAERATPEEIELLYERLQTLKNALSSGDIAGRIADADLELHQQIWQAAHNKLFLNMMLAVRDQLEKVVIEATAQMQEVETEMYRDHECIVKAIAAKDAERARARMQEHFDSVQDDLFRAIKQISHATG